MNMDIKNEINKLENVLKEENNISFSKVDEEVVRQSMPTLQFS